MKTSYTAIYLAVLGVLFPITSRGAESETPGEYYFEPELFKSDRFSMAALERLSRSDTIAPGMYKVELYVNGRFIDGVDIKFADGPQGKTQPCFTPELIRLAGLKKVPTAPGSTDGCWLLGQIVPGATSRFDFSRLRLDLSVPQHDMNILPRGYVDPQDLTAGNSMLFMNYIGSYYHVDNTGSNGSNRDSSWVSLNGGINLGMWQYRQLSNFSWDDKQGSDWNRIRSYVQRPVTAIESQLQLGELITSGRFFSGMDYNGITLGTDDRMRPDSLRGYAPSVRGIAATNARVVINQNGKQIYQTTVAPGPFEINDLNPTSYNGDLDVEVIETDGSVSRFSVPFSSVPESLRPGMTNYNLTLGRTRDTREDTLFGDLIVQQGISNSITFNGGARLADSYQSAMFGGVYGNFFGAFGLDASYSRARLPASGYKDGWMFSLTYSKTLQPTNTSISLAGYRYSTSGYRELGDVLESRYAARHNTRWISSTQDQRSRFNLSVSQGMNEFGNLFISAIVQNYRDGRDRELQYQLGYNKVLPLGINMSLSVARQEYGYEDQPRERQTYTSLSFSVPIGGDSRRGTNLSANWSHASGGGNQYQTSLSGMADDAQTISYNAGINRDQYQHATIVNGGVQKRWSFATTGLSASRADNYWQASGNIQGAVAVHPGGVTMGPYVGETFALVEAKGASGARVFNNDQLSVDRFGYALVPSMRPYRYNTITLDPAGMEGGAELIENERRVAPVSGAGVKVVFRTRSGQPLLIQSALPDGQALPIGAQVLDEQQRVIGMVGQQSQVYVRAEEPRGVLTVRWDEGSSGQCQIPYQLAEQSNSQALAVLTARCE